MRIYSIQLTCMCVYECSAHVDGYIKRTEVDSKIIIVGLQIHVSIILVMYIIIYILYIVIATYYTCTCMYTYYHSSNKYASTYIDFYMLDRLGNESNISKYYERCMVEVTIFIYFIFSVMHLCHAYVCS